MCCVVVVKLWYIHPFILRRYQCKPACVKRRGLNKINELSQRPFFPQRLSWGSNETACPGDRFSELNLGLTVTALLWKIGFIKCDGDMLASIWCLLHEYTRCGLLTFFTWRGSTGKNWLVLIWRPWRWDAVSERTWCRSAWATWVGYRFSCFTGTECGAGISVPTLATDLGIDSLREEFLDKHYKWRCAKQS